MPPRHSRIVVNKWPCARATFQENDQAKTFVVAAGEKMELLVTLDRQQAWPPRDQLYDGLRCAVLNGRLTADTRLPATRALVLQLGVSRFTAKN